MTMRFATSSLVGALALLGLAATATAQDVAPQFRDSRTGKVWTPDLADAQGQPTSPSAYVNREFDPRTQSAMVEGVVVQHPRANLMGTVPITAGPSVPIITLDLPSLQALPGRHWLTVLYVTNNSGSVVDPVVGCHFTNRGRKVEDVRVIVPPAGPGERLGLAVRGPQTDLFVDQVRCDVMTPI